MPRTTKWLPVDVEVGAKIRSRRTALGMSQTDLASHLGVTFQQVQKYEKGSNRVSASKLHKTAAVLGLSVTDLFELPSQQIATAASRTLNDLALFVSTKEGLLMNNAFAKLDDPKIRRRLIDLIRVLGNEKTDDEE